jgi:ubiquinone biosynthesis monooxygenase Coq7
MSFSLLCHMSVRRISQRARDEKTRKLLSRIIRVDQAGELGADRIYAGQIAVLGKTPVGPILQVSTYI